MPPDGDNGGETDTAEGASLGASVIVLATMNQCGVCVRLNHSVNGICNSGL